ncbi:hypothetical protein M378DRAFT_297426 [Amanita muscaria Koide BX008]|uniref:Uncharacterized protein n=1 Tax=Amanita muscaria (strain Koide BX008) TaxID=946122 RepID=A0A0C2SUW1_AMAMK|nr:hypothetical protein M378DRAFT_297426 [Amanita muscaria Koide BX008]
MPRENGKWGRVIRWTLRELQSHTEALGRCTIQLVDRLQALLRRIANIFVVVRVSYLIVHTMDNGSLKVSKYPSARLLTLNVRP